MGVRPCRDCQRDFEERRTRCPHCGALNPEGAAGTGKGGAPAWLGKALVLIAVLGVANVWQATSRDVGPDPELEALHSPQAAIRLCGEAFDSVFAGQNPSIVGTPEAFYLQGGEYEIVAAVELLEGRSRDRRGARCEIQFSAETGWQVEHVELDPS